MSAVATKEIWCQWFTLVIGNEVLHCKNIQTINKIDLKLSSLYQHHGSAILISASDNKFRALLSLYLSWNLLEWMTWGSGWSPVSHASGFDLERGPSCCDAALPFWISSLVFPIVLDIVSYGTSIKMGFTLSVFQWPKHSFFLAFISIFSHRTPNLLFCFKTC